MTLSHNAKLGTDKNKPQEFLRGSFTPSSTHRVSSKAVSWKQTIHCNDMAAYSPYITADYNYTPYPAELHTHTHLPTAVKFAQHRPHHPPVLRGTCPEMAGSREHEQSYAVQHKESKEPGRTKQH